jgi:hypothetical protein
MQFLWSLFVPRRKYRCFALLDANERCLAFKQCSLPPKGDNWVEIEEIRLNWLHQSLPASARVSAHRPRTRLRQALTS